MTTPFSAMTWNLENLYRYQPDGEYGPKTADVYEAKLNKLAFTIRSIGSDVIALQEIGDPAALDDLQARVGTDWPHTRLSTFPDGRGIRVGFLSRLPLDDVDEWADFPDGALPGVPDVDGAEVTRMGRGVLKVAATLPDGRAINLVTVHLKSKLLTYPGGRRWPTSEAERARGAGFALLKRAAEATAVRVFVVRLVEGNTTPLLLLGDVNDRPEAVTTQIMLGPSDLSLERADKFDDVRLYNLAPYIAPDRRYSRVFQKQPELIDQITVSHELLFAKRQVDSFVDPIASIDESVRTRREATFPDHAPVYARFELPEA